MEHRAKSIRPFIDAINYDLSRDFYRNLGFNESVLSSNMCYFSTQEFGFYLQNAYDKNWVDNTMVFMEVEDVERFWNELLALELTSKYENIKLIPVR